MAKLRRFAPLAPRDRQALARALSLDIRNVRVRSALTEGANRKRGLAVMLEGWACCYRLLRNGERHLIACYLPGDVCDLHSLAGARTETSIILLAGARIARLSEDAFAALDEAHPAATRALWLDAQIASSIEREWLVNVARRSARERIAHLLSEFVCRREAVAGFVDDRIELPIIQADFANACGLTASHANRVLRVLHDEGVVTWSDTVLRVHDRTALADIAGFAPEYLTPAGSAPVRMQPTRMLLG